MFVYSLCSVKYRCMQTFNVLDKWGKCVTWIAAELSWNHLTYAFLTHICMYGLAWVHVRLALHIFNTNNRTLFMFRYSYAFKILHVWKLFCYFELRSWCIHKSIINFCIVCNCLEKSDCFFFVLFRSFKIMAFCFWVSFWFIFCIWIGYSGFIGRLV